MKYSTLKMLRALLPRDFKAYEAKIEILLDLLMDEFKAIIYRNLKDKTTDAIEFGTIEVDKNLSNALKIRNYHGTNLAHLTLERLGIPESLYCFNEVAKKMIPGRILQSQILDLREEMGIVKVVKNELYFTSSFNDEQCVNWQDNVEKFIHWIKEYEFDQQFNLATINAASQYADPEFAKLSEEQMEAQLFATSSSSSMTNQ